MKRVFFFLGNFEVVGDFEKFWAPRYVKGTGEKVKTSDKNFHTTTHQKIVDLRFSLLRLTCFRAEIMSRHIFGVKTCQLQRLKRETTTFWCVFVWQFLIKVPPFPSWVPFTWAVGLGKNRSKSMKKKRKLKHTKRKGWKSWWRHHSGNSLYSGKFPLGNNERRMKEWERN